jgi:tetratricopeptide (TPR) repeat protein
MNIIGQKAPKWIDKARKSIFTLSTFDINNREISSTTAFFISETGEALSSYAAFAGAVRATATDFEGKVLPVAYIIGADDLYDVVKFKVNIASKRVEFLPPASEPVPSGSTCFILNPSSKSTLFAEASVTEATKMKERFGYYKISLPIDHTQANCPWLLPSGHVFALAQDDASGRKTASFGVSSSYAASLRYTSVDAFNSVYTKIGIRKAWPEDAEQASVSLFLMSGSQDSPTYLETLDDFIQTFPNYEDGYTNRAAHYATHYADLQIGREECLKQATSDMAAALKLSSNKSLTMFKQAQLIYTTAMGDSSITDSHWSIPAASELLRRAIDIEDTPACRFLEGDIAFSQGAYDIAYHAYMKGGNTSSSYYMAAKALENIPGSQISDIIALLDSAILKMGQPTPKAAAPYILERIENKIQLGLYKDAVDDYNLYYSLSDGKTNDRFYYLRGQAKYKNSDTEGALSDIREAVRLNDRAAEYHAEEAAILVRMQKYSDAMQSIEKALALAPDFASCYRLLGLCHMRMEKKVEACKAFDKAKELGDPLVVRLIRENCQ